MSRIKETLYDEVNGLFERMRNGDYTISEEEKQIIIDFSEEINNNLKSGQLSAEEAAIAIDIVHAIGKFNREEWPARLATEAYETMLKGIDFVN